MEFHKWLIEEKSLSQATASKYNLVIKNRILEWLPSYEIPKNSIEFEALKQTIFALDIYQERNRVGNNMYSSALNHYGNYLKEQDLSDPMMFTENRIFTSEAERLIKVRLTQNKFRKGLFDIHQCCAISGLNNPKFLIASHIKPWALSNDAERLDSCNGFLLTPNYDRLFDQGFISFKNTGEILIAKTLSQSEIEFFKVPNQLCIKLKEKHQPYLDFHFSEIFQK